MNILTHERIDPELCGRPLEIREGYSRVEFHAAPRMAVDEFQLVHGGFIFGLADYAAMIAVNHPNVVLGSAEVKFLKPVKVEDVLTAEAQTEAVEGKKRPVRVLVRRGEEVVFEGRFTCFVTTQHVLCKL